MEIDPQLAGFILYCTRGGKKWPALYDEMCRVAGLGQYQGMRLKDLRRLGLSLGLNHLEDTIRIIEAVTNSRIDNASLDCALDLRQRRSQAESQPAAQSQRQFRP